MTQHVLTLEDFPPVPIHCLGLYEVDDVVHELGSIIYQYGYDNNQEFTPLVLPTVSEMSQYYHLSELDIIRVLDKLKSQGFALEFKDTLSLIQVVDIKPSLILKLSRWLQRLLPQLPHPLKHDVIY